MEVNTKAHTTDHNLHMTSPISHLSASFSPLFLSAHAVGQISVDLTSLSASGVSFYVANGHKWLYGAHGTAMLWARPQYQSESYLVPATLSSTTSFIAEYEFTGTRDYTAFASLNATFNFRSWIGDAAIMNYIKSIADQGAEYLVGLFGTDYAVPLAMSHALVRRHIRHHLTLRHRTSNIEHRLAHDLFPFFFFSLSDSPL